MTNEQLVLLIQEGNNIKGYMTQLWQQNASFIHQICLRYINIYPDMEELEQEAYFGLDEAVKRYDITKGVKFLSYAGYWINEKVRRYAINNKSVRIPEYILYSIKDLGNETSLTTEEAEKIKYAAMVSNTSSLYDNIAEDMTLIDIVADENVNVEEEVIDKLDKDALYKDLWDEVEALPKEQARIIYLKYINNMSNEDICNDMGISVNQLRQKREKAINKLRNAKKLRLYCEDRIKVYARVYNGSLNRFNNTWASSTEKLAIELLEIEQKYATIL